MALAAFDSCKDTEGIDGFTTFFSLFNWNGAPRTNDPRGGTLLTDGTSSAAFYQLLEPFADTLYWFASPYLPTKSWNKLLSRLKRMERTVAYVH